MTNRIEDYGFIGDCRSGALVDKSGSIDWYCPGRFDAPACFAAIVGSPDNGHWTIGPVPEIRSVRRRYRADTLILETDLETDRGTVRLTDFMPVHGSGATIVRLISGLSGRVPMAMDLVIRFAYGRLVPWVTQENGSLVAVAGADLLALHGSVGTHGENLKTVAHFDVVAGANHSFVLRHGRGHLPPPPMIDADQALHETERFWRCWASRCSYRGPWRDAVVRSLLTLKGLSYAPTGGIVAAATASLPERAGGQRNWDYRYCWLRDATFTLLTLMEAGYHEEADSWRSWLERAVAGVPDQLQPVYTLLGEHRIEEWEAPWLGGFEGSRPVRIGNRSYAQLQLDAFGEVLDVFHHARRSRLPSTATSWSLQKQLLTYLQDIVDRPDQGIWEFRGRPRHFTHSKVMCWVAFDRAIAGTEHFGLDGPVDQWRKLRSRLHDEICARGFDPDLNSFVQAYDSKVLDASLLLMPLVGFLPAGDCRVIGTVQAVASNLNRSGFVQRYDTERADDSLPAGEGAFLACSFWLADNLILQGHFEEGRALFERLLDLRNDIGLLAEEYDPIAGKLMGNFPQALAHIALITTAFNLQHASGPAFKRGRHKPE